MQTRTTAALAIGTVAALAFATVTLAQTATPVADRFTFTVSNAEKAGPSGTGRMELVIHQWSSEADRARVFGALEEGSDKLGDAIWGSPLVGYMRWPGHLEYSIRYAYKVTRGDAEELILVTDRPVSLFWDEKAPKPAVHGYSVIQLHVDKTGKAEAKLGTKVTPDKSTRTFVLDSSAQAGLITDVRREKIAS